MKFFVPVVSYSSRLLNMTTVAELLLAHIAARP
jgi:hypothetical protein